jgi:hypothetical protein
MQQDGFPYNSLMRIRGMTAKQKPSALLHWAFFIETSERLAS